jgi:hypothetical protein
MQVNLQINAFSPNKHYAQASHLRKNDIFEALSNNTENKLNQVSAQQQSNSHIKTQLGLERQISFAPPQLSPKCSRSPFGSHANRSSRIDLSPPKDQKPGKNFESPNKGDLKVMPIIHARPH